MSISITAINSISALGTSGQIWEAYLSDDHFLNQDSFGGSSSWLGKLNQEAAAEISSLLKAHPDYRNLDKSVLYALWASRRSAEEAGWGSGDKFGINIGSSRGATGLFEKYFQEFVENSWTSSLASPTTTLGNISSWVAHDLQSKGPELSHSITCSTSLHSLINGIAWIKSGLTDKFLVGGSEAPLTPFTIAQMEALKIYSRETGTYPCRALDMQKANNSMVLGEGAAVACLEKGVEANALVEIAGIGYATEKLEHPVSLSASGECLQKSMEMACSEIDRDEVDGIVLHAPGTKKGDRAEVNAVKSVFGERTPALTTNKWKMGHTLGASGMMSLHMATLMLQHQKFIHVPFSDVSKSPQKLENILINSVGFGGNAVSILLKRIYR